MLLGLLQLIPIALGKVLSPLPIVAVITILLGTRGRVAGAAFVVGWFLSTWLLTLLMYIITDEALLHPVVGSLPLGTLARIVVGSIFFIIAVHYGSRYRTARGKATAQPLPAWLQRIETVSLPTAFVAGALLGGPGPKNLALDLAAALTIRELRMRSPEPTLALLTFAALGSLGVGLPVLAMLLRGDRLASYLTRMKRWVLENSDAVMCALFAAFALFFLVPALAGLLDW